MSAVIVERLSWPDTVDLLIDHDRPDVDALRDQAQVLRARLEEIAREFADDPAMPVTMVRTMTERVQAKLGDIEAQLADAGKVSVLSGLIGADDVRAVWEGLDVDRRRAVIDALMSITLHSTYSSYLPLTRTRHKLLTCGFAAPWLSPTLLRSSMAARVRCIDASSPLSAASAAVQLRRVPVSAGGDHPGSALVPADAGS